MSQKLRDSKSTGSFSTSSLLTPLLTSTGVIPFPPIFRRGERERKSSPLPPPFSFPSPLYSSSSPRSSPTYRRVLLCAFFCLRSGMTPSRVHFSRTPYRAPARSFYSGRQIRRRGSIVAPLYEPKIRGILARHRSVYFRALFPGKERDGISPPSVCTGCARGKEETVRRNLLCIL